MENSFNKAIDYLKEALELTEDEELIIEINKILAECYISNGDISIGIEIYKNILKQRPQNQILSKRIESLESRILIRDWSVSS